MSILALVGGVLLLAAAVFFWAKGRKLAGAHVFRASRFSRGNFWFPTQVAVTPVSVVHFTPEIVGGREHSMHISHIASVMIDRNMFFSDVLIESSGGTSPVRCHGHRKADAVADQAAHRAVPVGVLPRPGAGPGAGAGRVKA